VSRGIFFDINKEVQNVEFMRSKEEIYLDDGKATGFIKHYDGLRYSFAALLPNVDIPIEQYIAGLTGAGLVKTIENAEHCDVNVFLPKFEYDLKIKMNDILRELGMTDAFDEIKADFYNTSNEPLYISRVLHNTFISVDEKGTRAAAVTIVDMAKRAEPEDKKVVRLDRPFVFAIIDSATNLPIFMGTVMTIDP